MEEHISEIHDFIYLLAVVVFLLAPNTRVRQGARKVPSRLFPPVLKIFHPVVDVWVFHR